MGEPEARERSVLGHRTRRMQAEQERQVDRESGLQRTPETWYGTETPYTDDGGSQRDPATGSRYGRVTGGDVDHAEQGWNWTEMEQRDVSGRTRTTTGEDGRTTTDTARSSTVRDPAALSQVDTVTAGHSTDALDVEAMTREARTQLNTRLREATSERERQRIINELDRLDQNPDAATLAAICERNQLTVREQRRVVDAASTTATTTRGVSGYSRVREERETDAEGTQTTRTDTSAHDVDIMDGSYTRRRERETEREERDGDTHTRRVAQSTAVDLDGDQAMITRRRERSSVVTDEEGRPRDGSSTETSTSGGLVYGEDGTGVAARRSREDSQTTDGVTTATTSEVHGQVTDRGVAAGASREDSREQDGVRVGVRRSVDGSFTIDITQVPGSTPPRYRVVMTIGGTIGGELSARTREREGDEARRGGADVSVRGGLTGSAHLTFTHVMTEAEVQDYVAHAEAAERGQRGGAEPEFGMLARLRELARQSGGAATGVQALAGSPEAATALGDGESIELDYGGTLSGGISAGASRTGPRAASGSISASGEVGTTRRVRIASTVDEEGHAVVDITISFEDHASGTAGATGTMRGVTVGGTVSGGRRDGSGSRVRLLRDSPDFDRQYAEVMAADSPQQLETIAAEVVRTRERTGGGTGRVGIPGVDLDAGVTRTRRDDIHLHRDEGRVRGTTSGSRRDTIGASTGDTRVVSETTTTTATTTLDQSGAETTLQVEQADTDVVRSARGLGEAMTPEGDSTLARAADLITHTPLERLREQMARTYSQIERYQLSEHDVDVIVQRAADTREWARANSSPRMIEEWRRFGGSLRHPHVDAEEAAVNAQDALKLARGRVMARWLESHGERGMEPLVNVMRHWNERYLASDSDTDVGVHFQWPDRLSATRTRYDAMHARVRDARHHFAELAHRPDHQAEARAWYDDTRQQLVQVQDQVNAADIQPISAKFEMIERIRVELNDLDTAWREATHAPDTDEQTLQQINAVTAQLHQLKEHERREMAHIRRMFEDNEGIDANLRAGQLGNAHETWIARVLELRRLYTARRVSQHDWVVSTGPGQPRNPRYEPDMDTLYELYTRTDGGTVLALSASDHRALAARWRHRWESY